MRQDVYKKTQYPLIFCLLSGEILAIQLKSLHPIHRKIYGHGENNRFDSFVYTNKQYSSFFNHIHKHQTYIEIQNKRHVNSEPKVLSNTMYRISGFGLRTFIVEESESVNNYASKLFFLINLQCLLVYI